LYIKVVILNFTKNYDEKKVKIKKYHSDGIKEA
jgi:hypothetical protein